MLVTTDTVVKSKLEGVDGYLGTVTDILYGDKDGWRVRYLVFHTGRWLAGREVVMPPRCIVGVDWPHHTLCALQTRWQMEGHPSAATAKALEATIGDGKTALRSAAEMRGYRVAVGDEDVGRVDHLMLDDQSWAIRYLAVTTSDPSHRHVLLAPKRNWMVNHVDHCVHLGTIHTANERIVGGRLFPFFPN